MSTSARPVPRYRERLRVPTVWWLLLLLFLASLWLTVAAAAPPAAMAVVVLASTGLGAGLLLAYGGVRVEVSEDGLHAGRARLEWSCCGPATALDRQQARRLLGAEADARAYLLVRPYVGTAVRVEVEDPADPTPYWVLSSRHPAALAASINAARVLTD